MKTTSMIAALLVAAGVLAGCGTTYNSCADARAAGATPLHKGDPGYSRDLDRDGDGVACSE